APRRRGHRAGRRIDRRRSRAAGRRAQRIGTVSPVAAPADRRFRRAHVKPGRKRRDWRFVAGPLAGYGLLAAAVLYAGYRATLVVAHARMLQIDHIVVRGNERLSKGEVLAVLGELRGENLVWTDLDRWRRRLMASP